MTVLDTFLDLLRARDYPAPIGHHYKEEPVNCNEDPNDLLKYYSMFWDEFFVVIDVSDPLEIYYTFTNVETEHTRIFKSMIAMVNFLSTLLRN